MFRDTYKAANNDITPDSKLLAQTLSRIEQGKVRRPVPIRAVGACAAALMVTLGSVYAYVRYTDATSLEVAPEIVKVDTVFGNETEQADVQEKFIQPIEFAATAGKASEEKSANTDDGLKSIEDKADKNSTMRKTNTKTTTKREESADRTIEKGVGEPMSTDNSAENAAVPADENMQTDTGLATAGITDSSAMAKSVEPMPAGGEMQKTEGKKSGSAADVPVTVNSLETDIAMEEAGQMETVTGDSNVKALSGGGSAAKIGTVEAGQQEQITYSEYCEYIGSDLYEELEMPEDVIADRWVTADFDRNNDEVTFSYFGNDGRSAYITPTRNTEKIYRSIHGSQSDTKTSEYAFIYGESNAVAYIVSDGVGYTVNCFGFRPEEFDGLTDSILN